MSGLGFGMMSGLFAMVNVLADLTGPGTIGLYGDYQYFFIVTGIVDCFIHISITIHLTVNNTFVTLYRRY